MVYRTKNTFQYSPRRLEVFNNGVFLSRHVYSPRGIDVTVDVGLAFFASSYADHKI